MVHEEGEEDLLAIECRRFDPKIEIAESVTITTRPATVAPRPHNQHIGRPGVVLFNRTIDVKRPDRIFRVKPAADIEHGWADVLHELPEGSLLPEFIVVWVLDDLLPVGRLTLEIFLIRFDQRPHLQEEIVGIRGIDIARLARRRWSRRAISWLE